MIPIAITLAAWLRGSLARATSWAAVAVAVLAFAGCTAAPSSVPCLPLIQARVRAALPAATSVTCGNADAAVASGGDKPAAVAPSVEARATLPDGRIATLEVTADGKQVVSVVYAHDDLVGSSGKAMALLFWAFALASVVGAVFVVTRRNLIAAVMGMVGSFLGIAAIYMMLYAQFLAVVQMLVYAGAIMVLFVFVVMILNRPEDEPVAPSGRAGQVLGGLAILYLVARLILLLMRVEPPNVELANAAPLPTAQGYDWGSVGAVGTDLFGPGLFPFEAISILLLVAVVGAIAIARPLRARDDGDDGDEDGDPVPAGRDPAHGGHAEGGAA